MVVLMAARASRTENQDAIDTAIVGMLADPKEVSHQYPNLSTLSKMLSKCLKCSLLHLPRFRRRVLGFRKYISFLSILLISERL